MPLTDCLSHLQKIGNCLRAIDEENGSVLLALAGIDAELRPEQLSVADWCFLSNVYRHSKFYNKKPISMEGNSE